VIVITVTHAELSFRRKQNELITITLRINIDDICIVNRKYKEMEEQSASVCEHSGVIYSHHLKDERITEQFTSEHGMCLITSGALIVSEASGNKSYPKGAIVFFKKNSLAKFRKSPAGNESFGSITVVFDTKLLKDFDATKVVQSSGQLKNQEAVTELEGDLSRLEIYFEGLFQYFQKPLSKELMDLKTREALILLIQLDPNLKQTLFNFGQPGKIDLNVFMQQNFKFNVEMKKLAYLSGRSLASFKRDFKATFDSSPARWLHARRLQEAHFQLKEQQRRPSDVYHEVGFETFAHFSYAFKQQYGISPSTLT